MDGCQVSVHGRRCFPPAHAAALASRLEEPLRGAKASPFPVYILTNLTLTYWVAIQATLSLRDTSKERNQAQRAGEDHDSVISSGTGKVL